MILSEKRLSVLWFFAFFPANLFVSIESAEPPHLFQRPSDSPDETGGLSLSKDFLRYYILPYSTEPELPPHYAAGFKGEVPFSRHSRKLGSEFLGKRSARGVSTEKHQVISKMQAEKNLEKESDATSLEEFVPSIPFFKPVPPVGGETKPGSEISIGEGEGGMRDYQTIEIEQWEPASSWENFFIQSQKRRVRPGFSGKRRMGSEFLGKRRMGSEFLGKRRMGSEFLGKRALESGLTDKRRMGSEFLGKRRMGSEFLGKRRMGSEFLGKRRMGSEFLGKRRMGSEFLGKRRMGSEFLGKRKMGSEFLGKRRMGSEFLGKRKMGSEFLGKRNGSSEDLQGSEKSSGLSSSANET